MHSYARSADKNHTTDKEINRIAQQDSRVVISKDNDFLLSYIIKFLLSYIIKKVPSKLVIVATGNMSNSDLFKLFKNNIGKIERLLKSNHVIEINKSNIIVHY